MLRGDEGMILTIDGGGVRGIIPARVCQRIEDEFGTTISNQFSLVSGSSIGGIIACLFAMGKSADDVYRLMTNEIAENFRLQKSIIKMAAGILSRGTLYDNDAFMSNLEYIVGNMTLGELRLLDGPNLLVTASDASNEIPKMMYFVTAGGGFEKFIDVQLKTILKATSAAPLYFLPIEAVIGNETMILMDGGVGVENNTTARAIIEAKKYMGPDYGFKPNNIRVLSLGTGISPLKRARIRVPFYSNISDAVSRIMQQANNSQMERANDTGAHILRINPVLSEEHIASLGIKAKTKPSKLGLDSADEISVGLLTEIGDAVFEQHKEEILNFLSL